MPENFENNEPEELTNKEKLLNKILSKEDDDPSIFVADQEEGQKEKEQLKEVFKKLNEKEQKIINLRYGLDENGIVHTYEEIGQILGLHKTTVIEKEGRALKKLGVWREGKDLINIDSAIDKDLF